MSNEPVVIYVASSVPQAHLLKRALEERGIQSVVTNNVLEGGAGVDVVGWSTQARVMVDPRDAVLARQIAMEHDRRGAQLAQEEEWPDAAPDQATPSRWPSCPVCGRKRITACSICKTTGTDFLEADSQFTWGLGLPEVDDDGSPAASGAPGVSHSCGCGGGGSCHERRPAEPKLPPLDPSGRESSAIEGSSPDSASPDAPEDEPRLVLMCPTCDEPFLPRFASTCHGCGHRFADGVEIDLPEELLPSAGANSLPVLLTLAVLGLLSAAGLAYWLVLLR